MKIKNTDNPIFIKPTPTYLRNKENEKLTYFKDVYSAIPHAIEATRPKLKQRNPRCDFEVELVLAENPVQDGFYLTCDNISWRVLWNSNTRHVQAFQGGKLVYEYNDVNNSAKTVAELLIEDIHFIKLASTPAVNSDIVRT
jgi:hypothetical protein